MSKNFSLLAIHKLSDINSLIERRTKCDIFTTREYMMAMEIAMETPSAYKVTEVQFSDTKKLSSDYLKSVSPGKKKVIQKCRMFVLTGMH